MKFLKSLFFTIAFFVHWTVKAQFSSFEDTPLEAERISIEQGLSQSVVNTILQDQKGFMWFGTQDGLNKYDGYTFKVYRQRRGDTTSLIDNHINTIFQSKDGTIWVGTEDGLSQYHIDYDNFTSFVNQATNKQTLSNNQVNAISEDTTGTIWVGTDRGLNRLDRKTNKFTRYFAQNKVSSIPNDTITALYTDQKGVLWIGTKKGVARYQPKTNTFKVYQADSTFSTLPDGRITCFYEDKFKALWVGTENGIARYNRLQDKFSQYSASPYPIVDMVEDKEGHLWIISRLELGKFDQYTHSYKRQNIGNSFDKSDSFRAVERSKSGLLWLGTLRNGVYKININTKQFKNFKHNSENPHTLPPSWVWSIEKADKDALWIGTGNGWSYYNIAKDSAVNYDTFFPSFKQSGSRDVSTLLMENDTTLWIGVLQNGLIQTKLYRDNLTPYDFVIYTAQDIDTAGNALSGNIITKIYKDSYGKIWIGTYGQGLNEAYRDFSAYYHFKHFKHDRNNPKSISGNIVRTIFEDRKRNLWIGTDSGLNLAKRNANGDILGFERFVYNEDDSTTISSNAIRAIWEDESGYLWLATLDGLNRFDTKTKQAKHFGYIDKRLNRVIHGILGDERNNLWLSTNQGLLKFNIRDSLVWEFDTGDGLASNEFNSGAYYKRSDGALFFGGIAGVTMFYPDSVKPNTYLPPVVLTDFKIFNKSISLLEDRKHLKHHISIAEEVHIYSDDQVVTFEFVALNYLNPENNRYAYRLEGFEEYWNEVEDRRFASYTSLPPGTYKFVVRAANNDGFWNNEGASIRVIVHPPFHKTWWFRLLMFILISGGAYLVYFYRTKAITEQNIRLENSVKERTAELLEKTEELRVQRDQLETAYANIRLLSDIGQRITATLNHKEIIRSVYENLQKIMPVDAFGVAMYDRDADCLTVSGFVENNETLPFHVIDLSDKNNLAVKCFQEERDIIISNLEEEYTRYLSKIPQVDFGQMPTSVIYLPLILGKQKIGALTVQSYKENAFDSSHLSTLRNLATYIAIALDNAQAYSKIQIQNEEIERNRRQLQEKNKDITDSINYAKRIQDALLPPLHLLKSELDSFVLFLPRDIVSGDFYWFSQKDNKIVVAAIDCTGHGVPGAFMSIIAETHLNRIVNVLGILSPAQILEELDKSVRESLRQHETQSRDGMDLSLCVIDKANKKVVFAGAKNPLVYVQNGKVYQKKGSVRGIGGYSKRYLQLTPTFEEHTICVNAPTAFYLFSDGYQDQFGGKNNEKFMKKRFRQVLRDIHAEPMDAQKDLLERGFRRWQGHCQQIDDVLVIGFRLI